MKIDFNPMTHKFIVSFFDLPSLEHDIHTISVAWDLKQSLHFINSLWPDLFFYWSILRKRMWMSILFLSLSSSSTVHHFFTTNYVTFFNDFISPDTFYFYNKSYKSRCELTRVETERAFFVIMVGDIVSHLGWTPDF